MSKDRHGHEFKEVVQIQSAHLAMWKERLKPEIHRAVAEFVTAQNEPALDDNQRHRVFRGQDLIQIIMDWPNPISCYLPPVPVMDGSELI